MGAESMNEMWRMIPGLEGRYEVSSLGRIRNAATGRIRVAPLDRKGYPRVVLNQNGRPTSWAVHRAVLAAFMPRDDWQEMHVNHKDGNTKNNHLKNLEWCTASENRQHSYRVLKTKNPMTGRCGSRHHNARSVTGVCIATGEKREYPSISSVSADGFKPGDVSNCANGRQKSHRGWCFSHGTAGGRIWGIAC